MRKRISPFVTALFAAAMLALSFSVFSAVSPKTAGAEGNNGSLLDFNELSLVASRATQINPNNADVIGFNRAEGKITIKSLNCQGILLFNNIRLLNASRVKLTGGDIADVRDLTFVYKTTIKFGQYADETSMGFGAGLMFKFEDRSGKDGARGERRVYLRIQRNGTIGIEQLSGLGGGSVPTNYVAHLTNKVNAESGAAFRIEARVSGHNLSVTVNDEALFTNITVPDFAEVPHEGKTAGKANPAFGVFISRNLAEFSDMYLGVEEEIAEYFYSANLTVAEHTEGVEFFYENNQKITGFTRLEDVYTFTGLLGAVKITARKSGCKPVTVEFTEHNNSQHIVLKSSEVYDGKLTIEGNADGLSFYMGDGENATWLRSGNDYHFLNMPGDVEIRVEKEHYIPYYVRLNVSEPEKTIKLTAIGYMLTVSVKDENGKPVKDALVFSEGMEAYNLNSGYYIFYNLRAEDYIVVGKDGYYTQRKTAKINSPEIAFVLEKLKSETAPAKNNGACNSASGISTFSASAVLIFTAFALLIKFKKY